MSGPLGCPGLVLPVVDTSCVVTYVNIVVSLSIGRSGPSYDNDYKYW
jgi:hypothetical protein